MTQKSWEMLQESWDAARSIILDDDASPFEKAKARLSRYDIEKEMIAHPDRVFPSVVDKLAA